MHPRRRYPTTVVLTLPERKALERLATANQRTLSNQARVLLQSALASVLDPFCGTGATSPGAGTRQEVPE
jgi:hypothetical protein